MSEQYIYTMVDRDGLYNIVIAKTLTEALAMFDITWTVEHEFFHMAVLRSEERNCYMGITWKEIET